MNKKTMLHGAAGFALALGLMASGSAFAAPQRSAAAQPALEVSYSTDGYLTCDALRDEMARMEWFIAEKSSTAALVKTATQRKTSLATVLESKTSCGAAKKMDFGPGMYD